MRRLIVALFFLLVACAPATQSTSHGTTCHANGALPDSACTPGVVFNVTTTDICEPGYAKSVRNVTQAEKDQVFSEYGVTAHVPHEFEVDHLASLELGGSNDLANLFPQIRDSEAPGGLGFETKDRTENAAHAAVCSGKMKLADAQEMIETNWVTLCASLNVDPKCQITTPVAEGSP